VNNQVVGNGKLTEEDCDGVFLVNWVRCTEYTLASAWMCLFRAFEIDGLGSSGEQPDALCNHTAHVASIMLSEQALEQAIKSQREGRGISLFFL
jgi:hypothetical protein